MHTPQRTLSALIHLRLPRPSRIRRALGSDQRLRCEPLLSRSAAADGGIPTFASERSNLTKLKDIQLNVYRGRLERDRSYIEVITHEICDILSQASLNRSTLNTIGKVIRLFGFNQPYNQDFFDSISHALLKTTDETLFNALLPSFLWVCSRCQHYPRSLLSHAGQYLLQNTEQFNSPDLNMMVHAFAYFDHRVPGLIERVERWLLANGALTVENHLPWTLAWAGMVLQEYPAEMLTSMLSDDYIERKQLMSILVQPRFVGAFISMTHDL